MTNKLEQAARQALKSLEKIAYDTANPDTEKAIMALREALAEQAEQEPVAWCYFCEDALWGFFTDPDECDPDCDNEMPLYAAPVRTKDLTDDEIAEIFRKYASDLYKARAVIAADREKNK